jgi:7-cyano-7-deazaguanine synthase
MSEKVERSGALVLFSGGQDSTTCLAYALSRYQHVETVGFDYGQRHSVELQVREPIRKAMQQINPDWTDRLAVDHLVDLNVLKSVSSSALTTVGSVEQRVDGLPATFVPGRNIVFLTFAAIIAEQRSLKTLIAGTCETDFSGYPDCRDDTVKALQVTLNLGMQARLIIETPLMWLTKRQTWQMAHDLGGRDLVQLITDLSHTCYNGNRDRKHMWGYGCDSCDACMLRARGWTEYANDIAIDMSGAA